MVWHPIIHNSAKEEPQNCINYCSNIHENNEGKRQQREKIFHTYKHTIFVTLPFAKIFYVENSAQFHFTDQVNFFNTRAPQG